MERFLPFLFFATLLSLSEQTSHSIKTETEGLVVKGNLSAAQFPPDGYQYFPGIGYYKMDDRRETFGSAERICEADGGHLAIINSSEEAFALFKVFSPYYSPGVGGARLGFGDFFEKGEFRTIFGDPISSTGYTYWYPGQPTTPNERNCGTMTIETKLEIDCCDCYRYFVCEIEVPSANGAN